MTKIRKLTDDILVNIVVEINRRISYYNIRRFYMHFTCSVAPSAIKDRRKREITINTIALKRRLDLTLTTTNIVTYIAVSIFLPYILTAIVLVFLAIYILANKHTRQLVFIHRGTKMMKLFYLYVLAVPYVYQNWIGFAIGIGIIVALILGLYLRSVMTKDLYERVLGLLCGTSMIGTAYAALEAFVYYIDKGVNNHRISAMFSHPNYFGTIAATVILICAYKVLTSQENKWYYYLSAGMNIISLYLCKSMFAFVEVFIGVVVLLVVLKKYKLFLLWISAAFLGAYVMFFAGIDLIPRLGDVSVTLMLRQRIWSMAVDAIKSNPLFGHGFMSFGYLFHASYRNNMIPHSHSIYLDMILNFGVVGSIFFLWYFAKYYIAVIKTFYQKNNAAAALILAVTTATLVHGATDLTILWIQTLPLFLLILAGQGAEEKDEQFVRGLELV